MSYGLQGSGGGSGSGGSGSSNQAQVDANTAATAANTTALTDKQDVSEKAQPNGYASLGTDGIVPKDQLPTIDPTGLGHFLHNQKPFKLYFAHENQFSSLTINVNGVPTTFENLVNSGSPSPGVINFNSGGNGSFSKRANTVESIVKLGEYFEVTTGAESNFDTTIVGLANLPVIANVAGEFIRMFIRGTGFQILDENNVEIASGGTENGTYRFARTLYGFEISRNGTVLYTAPEVCIDHEGAQNEEIAKVKVPVPTLSGLHVVSEHSEVVNIGTNTPINTGHNFNLTSGMTWRVFFRDQVSDRGWQIVEKDVDNILAIAAASTNDGFGLGFDNDFVTVNMVDPATGQITMSESGRDFEYVRSELIAKLPQPGVGTKIGTKLEAEPGRDENDGLIPLIDGYTITNGATGYPLFAARWPSFVSGLDLVVPAGWNGVFNRNLGGNAAAFGVLQANEIQSHTHPYIDTNHNQFTNNGNGSNVARRGSVNTNRTTSATGGVETRPVNIGLQFYLILDNF